MGVGEVISNIAGGIGNTLQALNPMNQMFSMAKFIIAAIVLIILMIMIWIYAIKKENLTIQNVKKTIVSDVLGQ